MSKQKQVLTNNSDQGVTRVVKELKIVKRDNAQQIVEVHIVADVQAQRVLYEEYYQQLAKDFEMQGFRKGQAPRELVEPQIYSKVVDHMLQHLFSLALLEGIKDLKTQLGGDWLVLDEPEVIGVEFKMVETPAVFKLRFMIVPKPKLPDLKKFSLKDFRPSVTVTDEEVDQALNQLFEDWKAKVDKKTRSRFSEPTDEWVKELKLKSASDLDGLRTHLKGLLEKQKIAHEIQHKLDEVIHSILHEFDVRLPPALQEKLVKAQLDQLEQQLKQLGVTLEQYFKANNIDREEFEESLIHRSIDSIKSRLFWEVFIDEYKIKIEDTPQDKKYIEYVAFTLAAQGRGRLNTYELLTNAILVKAQDKLMEILGAPEEVFVVRPGEANNEGGNSVVRTEPEYKGKSVDGDAQVDKETKSDAAKKILIPDDAKI